jgi:hypothetical protein
MVFGVKTIAFHSAVIARRNDVAIPDMQSVSVSRGLLILLIVFKGINELPPVGYPRYARNDGFLRRYFPHRRKARRILLHVCHTTTIKIL